MSRNDKLLNYKMEKKFGKSFKSITIGFIVVMLLACVNIAIYAKKAGIGIFSSPSRAVGMLLLVAAVVYNLILLRKVAKNLTNALVEPKPNCRMQYRK